MEITWLGHASFRLTAGDYSVVLDPYTGVPGYRALHVSADAVYCSHEHGDHSYRDGVVLPLRERESPFTVTEIASFHDDRQGALRGSNIIRMFTAEGLRAVHLGDLGHPLSEEQAAPLMGCDALMIPVGGFFTIGPELAWETVEKLRPRVVIPMHYRKGKYGYPIIGTLPPFLSRFPAEEVVTYAGNTLTLEADTPRQVAVLSCE